MTKEAFILASVCLGVACSHQSEPKTPPSNQEPQMTPASGDEPVGRDYPSPAPQPPDDEYEDDEEGLDYSVPPSDVGPYRDDTEAPPP